MVVIPSVLVVVLAACDACGSSAVTRAVMAAGPTKRASRRRNIVPSLENRFGVDASETTAGANERTNKHHRVQGVMKFIVMHHDVKINVLAAS